MAPSAGGHLLVSKSLRLLRLGIDKAARLVKDKIPQASQPFESQSQPVYARVASKPVNRVVAIRQSQSRWYTTKTHIDHTIKRFYSNATQASKPLRSSYPPSRTGRAVSQLTSRAPFASTLRPNLTGGTLSRTSGGYGNGAGRVNGARYFSHTPASPAEVIQNVSQAVRAFWLSGQKAHFDGYSPKTGEKRFRAVSTTHDKARNRLDISKPNTPGSFIDFKVSPTITAVGPLSMVPRADCMSSTSCDFEEAEEPTITNSNLLTTLEVDFARALKDLAAIMNDLKHLSKLGSLPLSLINNTTLRVRFPGCDADTVESLCKELNIRRGIVGQDEDFDEHVGAEMALLFPFAPSRTPSTVDEITYSRPAKRNKREHLEWQHMMSPALTISPAYSDKSAQMENDLFVEGEIVENPWLSSPSGYSSFHASSEGGDISQMFFQPPSVGRQYHSEARRSHHDDEVLAYEGLEGIYRFIGECERAQR